MAAQDGTHASEASSTNQPIKTTPKEALVMAAILNEMGVNEYEPRVINQMIEFAYRYVTDVIEDARVYSQHANRKNLNMDDVKLAVSQKLDHSFTSPPPREFLLEIARSKNSLPLPLISDKSGLRLPPERYCLTGTNYKVKGQSKKVQAARKPSQSTGTKPGAAKVTSAPAVGLKVQSNTTTTSNVQNPSIPANTSPFMTTTPTDMKVGLSNLLKRKHEGDDDYDT